ncbi:MAG: fatty acid--CoA ligase family protein [Planctomycetes bacterium]|jgi:acyl-coenzyme A synthetase/AMP-(fatty) acid ligase|nr:fatty acid--CoA ligase family protein [Planctomycetota bacterium]
MPLLLAEAFAALLDRDPAAEVASTASGPVTRAALAAAAGALAPALRPFAGQRLAISLRDGLPFLAAVLACWQAGIGVVLLDAADPQAPRRDLVRRFGAIGVVHEPAAGGAVVVEAEAPAAAAPCLAAARDGGPFAVIKLTSGSTAEPRGIGVTAAALLADADQLERTMGIGAGDRVFAAVPMSFSYGVGNLLVPALCRGRTLVLPDARHPLGVLRALRHGQPTVLPAVPALLRALLQGQPELPATLRLVLSAGAQLPPAMAATFRARFGLPVHAFYGSTESGGICYDRTGTAAERGCVGAPVHGVDVTVAGDGRVVVRSAAVGVALDGGEPCDGVFVTPDLGEFDGSELRLRGRCGDVFEVGGHKVNPREIEQLVAELPGVDEVVVVPWRDRAGRSCCAAVVAARGLDELAVRRHCAQRLPAAKVPRCIVVVAELPRSCRGKLPRTEVERLLAAAESGQA